MGCAKRLYVTSGASHNVCPHLLAENNPAIVFCAAQAVATPVFAAAPERINIGLRKRICPVPYKYRGPA